MRDDLTEVAVVLDRSGSMSAMAEEAIGGFNAFLESQRQDPGEVRLSLVLFDHERIAVCTSAPLAAVRPLDAASYEPRGTTALHDAVATTIDAVGSRLAALPEAERPGRVIVAILTDGLENASSRYSAADVAKRIRHQREKYGWEFLFLGANQDVVLEAAKMAIPAADAIAFQGSGQGVAEAHARLDAEVKLRKQRPRSPVN